MRWHYTSIFFILFSMPLHGFVGRLLHDWRSKKAHAVFEQGDAEGAQQRYLDLMEQAEEYSAESLQAQYNLGRTSFELGEFERAAAYFQTVAQAHGVDEELQEQAYANWGYALFKQKKLHEALEQYEKVVELNPDNEMAQHNIEIIKKMLEQQDQQDNQQDQDNQQLDEQQQNNEQQQSDNDQGEGQAGQKEQRGDQGQQNGDKKEQQADQKKEMKDRQGADQRLKDQKADQKKNKQREHADTPKQQEQKISSQHKQESGSAQATNAHPSVHPEPVEGWQKSLKDKPELVALLQQQEERDAQTGKDMIKHAISQEMPEYDGQNCW